MEQATRDYIKEEIEENPGMEFWYRMAGYELPLPTEDKRTTA